VAAIERRAKAVEKEQAEFDEALEAYCVERDEAVEALVALVNQIYKSSEAAERVAGPANRLAGLGVQHAPVKSAGSIIMQPENAHLRAALRVVGMWGAEILPVIREIR
jgi:hypothetical protein